MNIDVKHTSEKIKFVKKAGPYLPEEFLSSMNNALFITERLLKFYEAIEFTEMGKTDYIKESIPAENNQERLNYISNIIQKEYPKDEINNMGKIVDIILKVNNYNKIMNMMNMVMENSNDLSDKDNLLKLIEPMIGEQDEKEIKKIKDMYKMMNLLMKADGQKKPKEDEKDNKKEKKKDLP